MRVDSGIELCPKVFDLDLRLDVEIADVSESLGPSGTVGRSWSPLDSRLRAFIKGTRQYTVGILKLQVITWSNEINFRSNLRLLPVVDI